MKETPKVSPPRKEWMMTDPSQPPEIANGDYVRVTGGTHAGKSGIALDRNISKTGAVTITVQQDDGLCFKTLARNVRAEARQT